jgi:chromosome segregation ATPase
MKLSLKPSASLPLLITTCLFLTSCKKTQELQKQLDEANAKVQAVQMESAEIDKKMADYRKEIPAYAGVGAAGAKQYAVQLAAELISVENQVAQAQETIKQAEAELEHAKKELQTVKSKDPR